MKYFLAFFVYTVGVFTYFYSDYNYHINENYQNIVARVTNNFEASINAYELSNDTFHAMYADTMAHILSQAKGASNAKKEQLQEQLKEQFVDFYNLKKHELLEGLSVIDKEGVVFYRFHDPKIFGDSILKRKMVSSSIKEFKYEKGLDIDSYGEAFYFSYPLFWDGEYVGMYQYAFSLEALVDQMEKTNKAQYTFLFPKEVLEGIVEELELHKSYQNFIVDDKALSVNNYALQEYKDCALCRGLMQEEIFKEAFTKESPTVIYYKDQAFNKTMGIFPLKGCDGSVISYLIVDIEKTPKYELLRRALFDGFLMFFVGAIVFYYYRKMFMHHLYVRNLLDSQHQMLAVTDGKKLQDANKAFLRFFGYKNIKKFKKEHDCVCDFFLPGDGYLQTDMGEIDWYEYLHQHPYTPQRVKMIDKVLGEVRIFELNTEFFEDTHKTFLSFQDITEQLLREQELEERANLDKLTGIYNRQKFDNLLDNEIRKAERYNTDFSLIMFDLDRFKKVNDTYGHDIGDYVLAEIARIVKEHIRDVDVFARWGGEEFMVIINTPLPPAEKLAEKLRLLIENHSFNYGIQLTCSFGVAQYEPGDTEKTLTKKVDTLLYSAKDAGRNCVRS